VSGGGLAAQVGLGALMCVGFLQISGIFCRVPPCSGTEID
jgi:hypothetical protein